MTNLDTAPIAILDPAAQPLRTLAIPIGFDAILPGSLRTLLLLEEMYSGIVRWRCRLADGDEE